MPIFKLKDGKTKQLKSSNFRSERELQSLIESNLEEIFGIKFIASEFSTGEKHGGRIDTLGLDENNAPVIIEYKWGEKDNVINQGLFYLDWLVDHKGDFQILVEGRLGKKVEVDWGQPRLILIASSFNKYDKYAINRMAENIELWTYRLYEGNILDIEIEGSSSAAQKTGRKITQVRYKEYKIEDHLNGKSKKVKDLFQMLREKILSLGEEVEEKPLKKYIAYRTSKNFAEVRLQSQGLKIWIDLPVDKLNDPQKIGRDMRKIGHWGTGDTQIQITEENQVNYVLNLIKQSYEKTL
jgi:predicted transport protein